MRRKISGNIKLLVTAAAVLAMSFSCVWDIQAATAAGVEAKGKTVALNSTPRNVTPQNIADGNKSAALENSGEHPTDNIRNGGGFAVTGQLSSVGYTAEMYDATNCLPTSDANYILASRKGYIWIGGYGGIIRYDGRSFERLDSTGGMTSGRAIFEDSLGRIWVGTNDNGVVMLNGNESTQYTYREGLPSSSMRTFAEGGDGTIYIGSTGGVSYVDANGTLNLITDERLHSQNIIRLVADGEGTVYGNTRDGAVFTLEAGQVTEYLTGDDLGIEKITTVYADPAEVGMVYLGTEVNKIYYGVLSTSAGSLRTIGVAPAENIKWITRACDRIWVLSSETIGYLDENKNYHVLKNIPMNDSIEMMTADYQGNIWFASSRQGVMKVVTDNFRDMTEEAGLDAEVVNATCLWNGKLYIGTDRGLHMLDEEFKQSEDGLTKELEGTRIRCLTRDKFGDMWVSTYTNDKGLICVNKDGSRTSFTEENGMPSNEIRCTTVASDGSILAGTNGGLAVIKEGKVVRCIDDSSGIDNTIFLTVEEGDNGRIYVGTDGDGIYEIDGTSVKKLGRDDGLTSDVILRIKKDTERGVYWIITSNSLEYIRSGIITRVISFPYNNNFDVYYDKHDNLWILSSYGVYVIKAQYAIDDKVTDYRLYTIANGLPCTPTANAFSYLDDEGNLYIAGRSGVSRVNIEHYFEHTDGILTDVRSVVCNDEPVLPDADGTYTIPAVKGRTQITPAILDYTLTNPTVHVYLEGTQDPGITAMLSELSPLEYTGLAYGNYTLHIEVIDGSTGQVYQDDKFNIVKKPLLYELMAVKIILLALLALVVGLIVSRVMTGTVIRRQYEQIRLAKEEAEQANSAKSRFLANMSHEIRTPINTIMGMDEMILREDSQDVPKAYHNLIAGYARNIKNASESLLGLINDLLDMSKIESGKMHLIEQEYDTAEFLKSITSMIRVKSQEKDLIFETDIEESVPSRLYGDQGKIKQVVLNLLTNAVKYTDYGGFTLKVSTGEIKENTCELRISVKDTGIGIKPEDMDKLFNAYERLDEEKNSSVKGTGLGLDISRRYIEQMGGKIWCESSYGEGSEFFITVNQKVEDPTGIGKFTEDDGDDYTGPYVPRFIAPDADVLIVDDNPMCLTVAKGLLKPTKIFVTTASSGEECLEKIKYGSFNVVLLDHMMPGMDGIETMARIREKYPDLPVYAMTANSAAGGEEFYKEKGFNGYLLKPVDGATLERTIMKHLPEDIMQQNDNDDK
ncbi:MAG: response regulator [Lachnospiraceae bacterium]|nr:response regulator [Lachnospiraceae bacterium]